jgi:hypothetical protein
VIYRTGLWIFCALCIHTVGNLSAIAILDSLQFTVTHALAFTSRIMATDLSQCNSLPAISAAAKPEDSTHYCTILPCTPSTTSGLPNTSYDHFASIRRKTSFSVVNNACFQLRRLAIDVVVFRAIASAGMGLSSRCLAMGIHVTMF